MYETPDVVALIYAATSQIPRGMVSTYGDIAQALGDSRAARAVGETLAKNPTPIVVPCHRVVYADGAVGWYGGKGNNHDKKTALLEAEGLTIKDGKIEDFAALRFRDFEIPHVLEDLQKEQEEIRQRVIAEDVFEKLEYVAGLDVSYLGERAFGACAVYDWQSGELVEVKKTECTIRFPYIPTYLSYRETPVFAKLTELPNTVYLIDGQGLLHPRAGIASHLGVVCDVPTVGAAKTPLYGQIGAAQGNRAEITVDGQLRGIELSEGSKKTYVSVGHRVSLATAEEICRRFLCRGIPLPLRTAHNEATLARKRAT
ncbi:endonuclease V [Candidatus Methanomassiliicoccus intestinalis]|uniref:endonuclease V n=1 Tax=Candidatus Methanomassiliicoccus intestinalis TaxID=1406512 RepID=UPI0037DCA7B2